MKAVEIVAETKFFLNGAEILSLPVSEQGIVVEVRHVSLRVVGKQPREPRGYRLHIKEKGLHL